MLVHWPDSEDAKHSCYKLAPTIFLICLRMGSCLKKIRSHPDFSISCAHGERGATVLDDFCKILSGENVNG